MADNTYTIPELDTIGSIDPLTDLLIIEDTTLDKTFKTTLNGLLAPITLRKDNNNVGIRYTPQLEYAFGVFGDTEMQGNLLVVNVNSTQLSATADLLLPAYGEGNKVLNTADYLLGVNANGDVIEVEKSTILAADNLGNHTATEALQMAGFEIQQVNIVRINTESMLEVKDVSDTSLFTLNSVLCNIKTPLTVDGVATLSTYGAGNNIDNSVPYILGVTALGLVKEYELTTISPIVEQNEVITGDPAYTSIRTIGFDSGQLKVGKEYAMESNLSQIELPDGDLHTAKLMVISKGDNTADADMIDNKIDYMTIFNSDAWSKNGTLLAVQTSDINNVLTVSEHGTMTIGPNHSISPADRTGADDIVKSSLIVGSSALAPFSSSDTHLIIADGNRSTRGDSMISLTNMRGQLLGSVPSRVRSQKESGFTFNIKDGYTCMLTVTAVAKVSSVGDSSLSVGDVAVLECQYIVDNNSGVISYKKVGTDTSTGLGVTTLSLASSMSAVPANKEVNLFITATNLGTTGIANVSTQMNYTWIK